MENPSAAQFCMACGARLERSCPECGTPALAEARFCMSCGTALDGEARPAAATPESPAASGALEAEHIAHDGLAQATPEQRRTVTVLFADLSGYTAIAERLDHETVKALDRALPDRLGERGRALRRPRRQVHRRQRHGRVRRAGRARGRRRAGRARGARHAGGDGRAQRAAARATTASSSRCASASTRARCSRASVGDAYTVVGDAVNVASRLQTSARPATISVGERTHRATDGVDRVPAAGAADAQGQGRAGRGLGGARAARGSTGRRPQRSSRGAAGRPRGRARRARDAVRRASRATARRTWSRSFGAGRRRQVARCCASSSARSRRATRAGARCARAAACRSARASSTGRSAKCCAPSAGSSTATPRRSRGRSSRARLAPLLAERWRRGRGGAAARAARAAARHRRRRTRRRRRARGRAERPRELLRGGAQHVSRRIAEGEPLVLAWEDIHWADEGMLDLIEYLSHWLRAPVLQVCLARDELLERRPSWGAVAARRRRPVPRPAGARRTRAS